MFDDALLHRAQRVIAGCHRRGWSLATAESCTGGLIAGCLTAVPGASSVVACGLVTYANSAKIALLGVPETLLATVGAVSADVAAAMAEGALRAMPGIDLAIAATGIAGPGGATPDKPVGRVYLGRAGQTLPTCTVGHTFPGDRAAVRTATVAAALDLLLAVLEPEEALPARSPRP